MEVVVITSRWSWPIGSGGGGGWGSKKEVSFQKVILESCEP